MAGNEAVVKGNAFYNYLKAWNADEKAKVFKATFNGSDAFQLLSNSTNVSVLPQDVKIYLPSQREEYVVVDGQHRLLALQQYGFDIRSKDYVVVDGKHRL